MHTNQNNIIWILSDVYPLFVYIFCLFIISVLDQSFASVDRNKDVLEFSVPIKSENLPLFANIKPLTFLCLKKNKMKLCLTLLYAIIEPDLIFDRYEAHKEVFVSFNGKIFNNFAPYKQFYAHSSRLLKYNGALCTTGLRYPGRY